MIPKKIHFCWLGNDPYPELIIRCIASWEKNLPDYEIVLWDRMKFDVNAVSWVKEALEHHKYAFACDYIRLHALYTEGGIYLDSDVEVLKNFDDLLGVKSFIGYESTGDVEPAIIGSEKGTEWIGRCFAYYERRNFIKLDGQLDTLPLPMVIGKVLGGDLPKEEPKEIVFSEKLELRIYPSEYFSPKKHYKKRIDVTSDTYAIHHFTAAWVNKKAFSYKCKRFVHAFLTALLGRRKHNKFVRLWRTIC